MAVVPLKSRRGTSNTSLRDRAGFIQPRQDGAASNFPNNTMSETTKQPMPAIATIISMSYEGKESNIVILSATVEELNHYLGTQGHEGTPETCYARLHLGKRLEEFTPIEVPGILLARMFAKKLGTRDLGDELTEAEEAEAKEKGLVVAFGQSDDCTEFRGAIHDEVGYGQLKFSLKGKFFDDEAMQSLESLVEDGTIAEMPPINSIMAKWDHEDIPWQYDTAIPHATFDVMEEGELFCRAIVFSIKDLK